MDKEQLVAKLANSTGLNPRRCKSFLERCGWNYEKTCELAVVKSALNRPTIEDIFSPPSETKKEIVKEEPKKEKKVEKPSEIVSDETKPLKGKVIQESKEMPLKRKRRTKKEIEENKKRKEEEDKERIRKMSDHKKTYNRFGFNYEVDVIAGREYFEGKEIHSDQSGFYHPYATMKEINEWTQKFMRKPSYNVIKK